MDNKEGFWQKVANGINEALGLHENADAISQKIQSSEQELSNQKEEYIIGMEQAIAKLITDKTQIQAEKEKMRKRGKRYETKNGKLIISNKEMSELDEALGQVTAEISQKMEILKKIISEREKLQLDDETCQRIDKIFHQIETSEQQNVNNEPIGEKTKKKVGEPKIEESEAEPKEEPEAKPEEKPEEAEGIGPKPKSKPKVIKDIGGNFANAMRFIRKILC